MNQFKKYLEEQTPISPSQKQRIKNTVLCKKNNKRHARFMPMVVSFMFGIAVIAGCFMLLLNKETAPIETGTSSITDEREQVEVYLETGDERYLEGVSPETILKTYLFTKERDGSSTPEVKALALEEFVIQWPYELTYHEEKFNEMLEYVPASIDHNYARMHIKGWDIPFITVEFRKVDEVWKISNIE